jgi:hypothetical protein
MKLLFNIAEIVAEKFSLRQNRKLYSRHNALNMRNGAI